MSEVEHKDTIDSTTRHLVEVCSPLGPVIAKPLFEAWALYLDDRIFAIVADGTTYFRTTPKTIHRYVDAGSPPFVYYRSDGVATALGYHEVPPAVLADGDRTCAWAYEAATAEP